VKGELPEGWCNTKLGNIIDLEYGKGLVKKARDNKGESLVFGSNGPVGKHSNFIVKDPCLIVGRKGAVGEIHISKNPCWPIDTTYFVIPPYGINLYFLFHLLSFLKLGQLDKSTAIPGLNRNDAYNTNIYLPPSNEQRRIVDKIEELFTKLDAGIEALKKAKSQLKKYRQSVLKAAVEGKLTEEWREQHKDELEPADKLLERILKERRAKWEAEQLAKYKSKGKKPPKDWKTKYKEPTPPDTNNLPKLPEKWVVSNIEQLAQCKKNAIKAGPFGSSLKKSYYVPKGYKIYGQEQVLREDSSYGDYYIDKKRFRLLKSCEIAPGDILISLVGTIGKVLILPKNIEPGIINPRLIKLSLDKSVIIQSYFKNYLQSPSTKSYFKLVSHGGTMDILNLTILKKLPIPLPPIKEQTLIVQTIDKYLSIADEIENTLESELKRAQSLRQSILKRAFEGKLVPQNPNDEPASVLLERIKKEKEN